MKKQDLNIPNEKFDNLDLSNLFSVYENSDQGIYFNLNKTINFTNSQNIPETKFQLYQPKTNENWQLISYKVYGTIKLWWIICKFNGITNPFKESPEEGRYIKILNKDLVNQVLSQIKTN